ncbi:MAG: mechanosensitive ion channel protein MscS, partial [Cyanobacteria bacterium J06639_18]
MRFIGMLPHRGYLKNSTFKFISIALIGFLLSFLFVSNPASAVLNNDKTAPVVVDGNKLFRLAGSDNLEPKQRAEGVNRKLEEFIQSEESPRVEIKTKGRSPVITINGKDLVTVTNNDTVPPYNADRKAQANSWRREIAQAINSARRERSASFIRYASIVSAVIVAMGALCHKLLGGLWQIIRTRVTPLLGSQHSVDGESSDDENDEQQHKTFNFLLNSTLLLVRTTLWVGIILYISNLFPLTRRWSFDITNQIIYSLTAKILPFGGKSSSVIEILILVCLFCGLFIVAGAVTNILRSRVLRLLRISRGAQEATAVVFKYLIIAIG